MCEKSIGLHSDIKRVLFSEEQIHNRVVEIGAALTEEYSNPESRGNGVVLVCILRGSALFTSDLARELKVPLEMDYMVVSSYGDAAESSGQVRILKDLASDVCGKHVIVVEDILDTGLTLSRLVENLQAREPASVEVVVLLRKDRNDQVNVSCKHIGFECPDEFVVGYGLDFAERYRNLPYIGILKPELYQ